MKSVRELQKEADKQNSLRNGFSYTLLLIGLTIFSIWFLLFVIDDRPLGYIGGIIGLVITCTSFYLFFVFKTPAQIKFEETKAEYDCAMEKIHNLDEVKIYTHQHGRYELAPILLSLYTHLYSCITNKYEHGIVNRYFYIDDEFFYKVDAYLVMKSMYNHNTVNDETVENVKRIEAGLLSEAKKYYDRMMKKQGELSTAAVNEAMCVFYE